MVTEGHSKIHLIMIKFLFKSAFRNIRKDLYQSTLNIIGLALGFAALLYICSYFFHEYSFDKFHAKEDRIYRCVTSVKMGETAQVLPISEIPIAEAAKKDIPEIEDATRLYHQNNVNVKIAEEKYLEEKFWFADENFLQIFDFELLEGDKTQVLSQPYSVVLTEEYSKKYFGNENPVGKSIQIGSNGDVYRVTGILKNIPSNSHLQFQMLASFSSLKRSKRNQITDWGNFQDLYTFILAKENIDNSVLMEKFQKFPRKYYISMMDLNGFAMDEFEKDGGYVKHSLQPLAKIHLNDTYTDEVCNYGNRQMLHILGIIGLFIIVIACFNFINLTTARATLRAKEIGVKKIIGSSKGKIVAQLLTETFIQCFMAFFAALTILFLSLSFLNGFTGLNIEFAQVFSGYSLVAIISIPILVVVLAGLYPAIVVARFNPVEVINGSVLNWNSNSSIRNILVVFQFVLFITLICGTLVVKKQVNLLSNQNPGFHKENVLIVKNSNKLGNNRDVFKQQILNDAQVISASYTSALPSLFDGASNPFGKTDKKDQFLFKRLDVDIDFIKTLKIEILDGRDFIGNANEEKGNAIINKKAAELLGWTDCTDKIIYDYNDGGNTFNVIGIVDNFHIESLRNKVEPAIIRVQGNRSYLAIRIQPESAKGILALAKTQWEELNNEAPFEYAFLDEAFDSQYKEEVRFGKMISLFSILSIVIACLGLLGLVSFTLSRRRKEIGIRKVNGARISEVLIMLNRDIVKWVVIAFSIAIPMAYFAMYKWLENFAYKTNLSWWIFALAGILALGIALLTVSWQSWRAASRNPVESLRYE
jgi:putative ABC transport system permease protein